MTIGPLEYIVIGIPSDRFAKFAEEVAPALAAIQAQGSIRVTDLLFIEKGKDGELVMREVDDLADDVAHVYVDLHENLLGLLTAEDIERLAERVPLGGSAMVALLEHVWALTFCQAVARGQGVALGGGMAAPDALARLEAELTAGIEAQT
jgi:hypothetical protein